MPRLNIKSTKAAFVKELKYANEQRESLKQEGKDYRYQAGYIAGLLEVAKELEIEIKPEEYK